MSAGLSHARLTHPLLCGILGAQSAQNAAHVSPPHLPSLPDQLSFASELIKARAEMRLTQAQLAEKSGLSLSAIKSYESGRNMPGTRELRELCQALQISPNKLLFGTELPFEQRTMANLLVDFDTDNHAVVRMRLAMLANMLASDEQLALITLANSIAVARHGEEKVRTSLKDADAMAGMGRVIIESMAEASKGTAPDPNAIAQRMEDFMKKQGYGSDLEKLPKK